jgi:hypothetical protein
MSTNTTMRSNPAFLADVASVQPLLAAWRRQRKRQEPIPESLWHAIVRLARNHRPSPVAQAFRVNYASLQRRLRDVSLTTPADDGETDVFQ